MGEPSSSSSSSPAAVPGKIFVGGISPDTDEAALAEHFGRYGNVERAAVVRDWSTGTSRGFGFVTFAVDSVDAAISASDEREKDRHIISGKKVDVKPAIPKEHLNGESSRSNSYRGQNPSGKKIFAGGLPKRITDDEFRAYFEKFGVVTDSIVMHKHDHTEKTPRGFGFVTFASEESACEVLKDQFHELNGKKIEVKRAVPKIVDNFNPSPTHSGNNANNNNVSCNSGPLSIRNFNVHSYTPCYPINNAANPYSQLSTYYSPYVDDNAYYLQSYTYHFYYDDDAYYRWHASPYTTDYSAWYRSWQYWADQGMTEWDAYMMEEMELGNINLHGPAGDFTDGRNEAMKPHCVCRQS